MADSLPLARQGVFHTIQGEGVMLGVPMVFVRFAGCPVNCPDCDTDYAVHERVTISDLCRRVCFASDGAEWVWLTGGEPTIHDLAPVVGNLQRLGFRVALATAGINPVQRGYLAGGVDFLSVSPHFFDDRWTQRRGDQLNIVPGLNGLSLTSLEGIDTSGFSHKFVTPVWYAAGDRMERVRECVEWVRCHPDWRLGVQAHKAWGVA